MIPWQIVLYPLDGGPPEPWALTEGGRSLSYCQRMVSLWQGSFCNDGLSEAIIEPLHGWQAVDDPVLLICHALYERDLTPDVAAAQLRALALREQGATQQEAAEAVGVTQPAISLWESGTTIISDGVAYNSCTPPPDNRVVGDPDDDDYVPF